MKIKAYWKPTNFNPFVSNTNSIPQTLTSIVDVPENTSMVVMEQYAKEATPLNYIYDKIEKVATDDQQYYDTYHGGLC